jgi:thermitase
VFQLKLNTTGAANGMNTLVATAYDKAGNAGASTPVSVNVANTTQRVTKDTTPPAVAIDNPVAGTVSGTVAVSVHASDNAGAAALKQTLYIDSAVVATGTGGTLAYNWRTRYAATGYHTVKVVARDAAGNWASSSVTVRVVR